MEEKKKRQKQKALAANDLYRDDFYRDPSAASRAISRVAPLNSFKFLRSRLVSSPHFLFPACPLNIADEHLASQTIFHASRWRFAKRNETRVSLSLSLTSLYSSSSILLPFVVVSFSLFFHGPGPLGERVARPKRPQEVHEPSWLARSAVTVPEACTPTNNQAILSTHHVSRLSWIAHFAGDPVRSWKTLRRKFKSEIRMIYPVTDFSLFIRRRWRHSCGFSQALSSICVFIFFLSFFSRGSVCLLNNLQSWC